MAEQWTLALDIGGTKLAAGLVGEAGTVAVQESMATRNAGPADALFDDLVLLANRVLAAASVRPEELLGIGVGRGGPMHDPEGIVSPIHPWYRALGDPLQGGPRPAAGWGSRPRTGSAHDLALAGGHGVPDGRGRCRLNREDWRQPA
jgi:glucokinase